jgi:hypothetical protein
MPEENQIDGIYRVILTLDECEKHDDIKCIKDCRKCLATHIHNSGYIKQREGEWEWFEEWSPSTPEHPSECYDCGWRCGRCKTALEDVVGGYWDDPEKKPNLNFCPECGAKMKGV